MHAGQSDGSGEDDMSPVSGGAGGDHGGVRQFPDQRGRPDQSEQQDIDYSSSSPTLWSKSSRYTNI